MSGVRRQCMTFHVWDRVYLALNAETLEVRLQWKARELWSRPNLEALAHWISVVSLYFGEVVQLDTAAAMGWTMTGLEICADFTALRWAHSDAFRFVGGCKPTLYTDADGELETAAVGRRSSNVSWVLYDKTRQIETTKRGQQTDHGRSRATYVPTWSAYGYAGGNVSRVEFRLAQRGLTLHDENGEVLDLRDPKSCTPKNIARAWQHVTSKYRMIDPIFSRRERCPTDGRWAVVQSAVSVEPERLVQYREVPEGAHEEKVTRASKMFGRALSELAALHGVRFGDDTSNIAAFAADLAAKVLDIQQHQRDYSKMIDPCVGAECQAARGRVHLWWSGSKRLPPGVIRRERTDADEVGWFWRELREWSQRGPPGGSASK